MVDVNKIFDEEFSFLYNDKKLKQWDSSGLLAGINYDKKMKLCFLYETVIDRLLINPKKYQDIESIILCVVKYVYIKNNYYSMININKLLDITLNEYEGYNFGASGYSRIFEECTLIQFIGEKYIIE